MKTERCFRCGVVKTLDGFYRHAKMADGRLGKCIECTKRDVRRNYAMRREQYSIYEQERSRTPARRSARARYAKLRRKAHPTKVAAWQAVGRAVRSGQLQRRPCEVCGGTPAQAHHEDYSRPLDVRWMCFVCHREEAHGQVVTCRSPF